LFIEGTKYTIYPNIRFKEPSNIKHNTKYFLYSGFIFPNSNIELPSNKNIKFINI